MRTKDGQSFGPKLVVHGDDNEEADNDEKLRLAQERRAARVAEPIPKSEVVAKRKSRNAQHRSPSPAKTYRAKSSSNPPSTGSDAGGHHHDDHSDSLDHPDAEDQNTQDDQDGNPNDPDFVPLDNTDADDHRKAWGLLDKTEEGQSSSYSRYMPRQPRPPRTAGMKYVSKQKEGNFNRSLSYGTNNPDNNPNQWSR